MFEIVALNPYYILVQIYNLFIVNEEQIMGKFYCLKCPQCGYEFETRYGCGRDGCDVDLRLKIKLENQEAEPEIQAIYNAMKTTVDDREKADDIELAKHMMQNERLLFIAPRIATSVVPYQCDECHYLFNHTLIQIITRRGKYIDNYTYCPSCNYPYAAAIHNDDIIPGKNSESNVLCPHCKSHLTVTEYGFWD